jgi:hypothetical protein
MGLNPHALKLQIPAFAGKDKEPLRMTFMSISSAREGGELQF